MTKTLITALFAAMLIVFQPIEANAYTLIGVGANASCGKWLSERSSCEIASNRDPSQIQNNSLIKRGNTQLGWGHDWARHATPSIAIFHNEINALRSLRGGVNVGCDFTRWRY